MASNTSSDSGGQTHHSQIELATPAPLSSDVAASAPLVFRVDTLSGKNADCENAISVTAIPSATPVNGHFTWTADQFTGWLATFTPDSAFSVPSELRIAVAPFATCDLQTPFLTGVSIGSHPRVSHIEIAKKASTAISIISLTFSEPMQAQSVSTTVSFIANGVTLQGQFEAGSNNASSYVYTLSAPSDASEFTIRAKNTLSSQNTKLDANDWTATTVSSTDGAFEALVSTQSATCGLDCWQWTPEVP